MKAMDSLMISVDEQVQYKAALTANNICTYPVDWFKAGQRFFFLKIEVNIIKNETVSGLYAFITEKECLIDGMDTRPMKLMK